MDLPFISAITQEPVQAFLIEHENDDEKKLVLKQKEINGIPTSAIATQLIGRRKAKAKLPTWYKTRGIVYPPAINLEQCSSEATAIYKTQIINSFLSIRHKAADLTGGFGVDTYFLSFLFEFIYYTEPNTTLFEITRHNHRQLGVYNILYHNLPGEDFLKQIDNDFDLIYIDPSRRDEMSRKVYRLSDCIPDINKLQPDLFHKSRFVLVKASPLLDLQQGLREIQCVKRVFVVSVHNECKELLFLTEKNYSEEPIVEAVDLYENGKVRSTFHFSLSEERKASVISDEPGGFLYEPNTSILKAGAFKLIAEKFGLTKLASNTHLYTSSALVPDFPGKTFLIECLNPDSKQLNERLPDGQVNVVSRNYPLTTDEIKKKWQLRDGGEKFLIAFSTTKRKHLALCAKVKGT
jgi:hypothetical protein